MTRINKPFTCSRYLICVLCSVHQISTHKYPLGFGLGDPNLFLNANIGKKLKKLHKLRKLC